METLPLPTKVEIQPDPSNPNHATVVIEPCYPGYGTTLGNALRRVLLSSLPGAAVIQVKLKGVQHEFSSLPGVREDVVDIILNLKQLRVKIHEGEEATLTLKVSGEKTVKAKDITLPSNVDVLNPDLVIAQLTEKTADFEMKLKVQQGRGYVPVEVQQREKTELGAIAVDAIYTPVKNVNFDSENVRVGQMTNFDRLTLSITTDGTLSPAEALRSAAAILVNHFSLLDQIAVEEKTPKKRASKKKEPKEEKPKEDATEESSA